jgi:hypothetical protein
MSLRQFIEMGKKDKPWVFAPIAHSTIAQSGYDPELWFLLAENLAALGLKTLASAQLEALCQRRPTAANTPVVSALRHRIEKLEDDRIAHDELAGNAKLSVDALQKRGIDVNEDFEIWKRNQPGSESFRAIDGNIVRLAGEQLLHFGDQIGAAREIGEQNIARVAESHAPFTIEGIDPPWLLIELDKQTPMNGSGYQPGIRIIQADIQEFLDGCSMADISGVLAHKRVDVFVGTAAAVQFKDSLERDAGTPISGPYMPLRSLRTPSSPSTTDLMRSAIVQQDAQHTEHLKQIHKRDALRDETWWRNRLIEATTGKAEPLRILITTCRFTTVLHSMCVDLTESLQKLGCTVELLTERSEHHRLSPLAYSEAIDRLDPDIILAPNYTRRDLEYGITGSHTPPVESRVLPTGVPFVVWVQDSMPHLLTTESGAGIGPLDIALGYISIQMIRDFGYPREAVEPAQLVASASRFSIKRIDDELCNKYACDMAMMTHGSETPDSMKDRLLSEIGASSAERKIAEGMIPEIDEIFNNINEAPGIHQATLELIKKQDQFDRPTKENLLQNFVYRIIDRELRHQTAHWASELSKEHGWSFKIFGKGWENHSTLSRHAAGELPYDSELCSAYSAAGLTLQVSAFNPIHQRLFECALSGGCPIIRRSYGTFSNKMHNMRQRILKGHAPDSISIAPDFQRMYWYEPLRSLDTARLRQFEHARNNRYPGRIPIPDPTTDPDATKRPPTQPEADPFWILGDADEMSFATKEDLYKSVARMRAHTNWRTSAGSGIATRARQHFTHDAIAEKLISKIKQRAAQQDCGT